MLDNFSARPRRLRRSETIRGLVQEVDLRLSHLIQPYFLTEGASTKQAISGFTGVSRWGIDTLSRQIEQDVERGVRSFLLFGEVPDAQKDEVATAAYRTDAVVVDGIRKLRERFGRSAVLFSDVCLCPYTSHGHCGVVRENEVANDPSLDLLAKMAGAHAEAGVDFVAPSDMMDGRIGYLRKILDQRGFSDVGIMAYTAKYASSYYGPFREALGISPQLMDRAGYQMDYRNSTEAMRELQLDLAEGADFVMVKPALAYLDIIAAFRRESKVPVAAYSVSGEYEMVKQLAAKGAVDERKMVLENLTAIRRAGAQVVISYFTSEAAERGWIR